MSNNEDDPVRRKLLEQQLADSAELASVFPPGTWTSLDAMREAGKVADYRVLPQESGEAPPKKEPATKSTCLLCSHTFDWPHETATHPMSTKWIMCPTCHVEFNKPAASVVGRGVQGQMGTQIPNDSEVSGTADTEPVGHLEHVAIDEMVNFGPRERELLESVMGREGMGKGWAQERFITQSLPGQVFPPEMLAKATVEPTDVVVLKVGNRDYPITYGALGGMVNLFDKMSQMLKDLEHKTMQLFNHCPVCDGFSDEGKHRHDCELAALIRELP